jgi:UDP-N-acetylglucosamine diphosphorylase/glucosamine-1-phosphate N-acetyltransferase
MKFKNILIFETEKHINYYPFNIMHPIWELRCGSFRLFEKVQKINKDANIRFVGRELHTKSFIKRFQINNDTNLSGAVLIMNAQIIPNKKFFKEIQNIDYNTKLTFNGHVAGYLLSDISKIIKNDKYDISLIYESELNTIEMKSVDFLEWIYESLDFNGSEIENDTELLGSDYTNPEPNEFLGSYLIEPKNIFIGNNVKIAPGAVLDASKGKIIIGHNSEIMPQATIVGPASVGENNKIKIGAKIYEDSSFGEWCKIGGEIENTIIQSYSNKQHEGFLGHSFISEWVNLGADTNNSDLKNTYGNIKIRMEDRIIDTGRMFMGLLCGDHTKSSINAMFTTGSVAGICGIIVREWFMPNYIKSFTWGGKNDSPQYHFKKAIETAKIVMKRRNKDITDEEIELMKIEYEKLNSK